MQCSKLCPMLNQFGVCRDTMRKPERLHVCPHQTVHKQARRSPQKERAPVG